MNEIIEKNGYITDLIRFMESNLSLNLDTDTFSKLGFISHAKLYRDFYSFTGHTAKEYLRKRRLSNALALIKASEFTLTDIAYKAGYSSQQALCRAVRNVVKMTPTEYKNSDVCYFFPPLLNQTDKHITVTTEMIPRTLCLKYHQASLRGIENSAIEKFSLLAPDFAGRIFGKNGKQNGSSFCYELYISDYDGLPDLNKSDWFEINGQLPEYAATFATATVCNDENKINSAWDDLFTSWLSDSMFEYAGVQYFEEYILRSGKPAKLRLFLPIRKRNGHDKITLEYIDTMRFLVSEVSGLNAESRASRQIMEHISQYYPYLIKTSNEYYIQEKSGIYSCGIRINAELTVPLGVNVNAIDTDEGLYAIFHSRVTGDYNRYCQRLLSWIRDNGMTADENTAFAVYDATQSYDSPGVSLYCRVK